MKNLLNSYFYVGEQDFFSDFDGRRNEYSQILQLKYRNFGEETVKGKKGILFWNPDSEERFFLHYKYNPIVECFTYRRQQALNIIRAEIRKTKSMQEVQHLLEIHFREFTVLKERLEKMIVKNSVDKSRSKILDGHIALMNSIKKTYLADKKPKDLRQPKIKWLGQINQLGTLFYDLWQGSKGKDEDGKLKQYPPLISASKEDLMALVENNFTDSKGNTISHSTLSDALNTSLSKANEKASGEKRIELKYKL